MDSRPVRVVLVDDHELVIEGLKAMLARFTGRVRVVGQAGTAEDRAARPVDRWLPNHRFGAAEIRRAMREWNCKPASRMRRQNTRRPFWQPMKCCKDFMIEARLN